jgi:hypothetical protein
MRVSIATINVDRHQTYVQRKVLGVPLAFLMNRWA